MYVNGHGLVEFVSLSKKLQQIPLLIHHYLSSGEGQYFSIENTYCSFLWVKTLYGFHCPPTSSACWPRRFRHQLEYQHTFS